ncbi:hypothetical protein Tco_1039269 [Tanacetum coccineum]
MKMEILLEPASNKLLVVDLRDSIRIELVSTGKKRWEMVSDCMRPDSQLKSDSITTFALASNYNEYTILLALAIDRPDLESFSILWKQALTTQVIRPEQRQELNRQSYLIDLNEDKSIPCFTECKIVGQILLDHPLSYALTATADVLDMFQDILHLPVETPENLCVAPVNIETIEAFVNKVGYQGVVDKVSAFYTKNLTQPWQTMFKVFNRYLTTRTSGHDQTKINILQMFHAVINQTNVDYAALLWWDFMNNVNKKKEAIQIEEDYDSFKDDIPLEIRATDDFKKYEKVFMNVDVPMNQPQLVVSTQGTHRSIPRAYRTPTLTTSPQGKKRKQSAEESSSLRNIHKITIKKRKQSLALHKTALAAEAQENVAKVQENWMRRRLKRWLKVTKMKSHMQKAGEIENDDNVEKTDKVVKEQDIVHDVTGSMEIRKEQKQTPIPSSTRSHTNVSSSDKTVFKELTVTISPTTTITSKYSSTTKRKKRFCSHMTKTLPGSIIHKVLDHCNKVLPDKTSAKTSEMINQEMPRLVNLLVNKDRKNTTLNLYPTTSTSTARKSSADLQDHLYLNMKSKPQD